VFITHVANEAAVQATLRELRDLPSVHSISGLMRVIGG
jgi:HEPN domain-containing protein